MENPPMITSEEDNPDKKSGKGKPRKTVSFAQNNQIHVIEYQEPIIIEEDRDESVNNDIESMIAGGETSSSHVSFDTLDKLSAGTAFDTTSFNAFPRRLSAESVGPAGFCMDDVIQKLLNIQACNALGNMNLDAVSADSQEDTTQDTSKMESTDVPDDDASSDNGASIDSEDGNLSPTDLSPLLCNSPNSKNLRLTLDSIIGSNPGSLRVPADSRRSSNDSKTGDSRRASNETKSADSRRASNDSSNDLKNGTENVHRILSQESDSKVPSDRVAHVVATPRRVSTSSIRISSPSDSKRVSLVTTVEFMAPVETKAGTQPITAPLTVVSSEKEEISTVVFNQKPIVLPSPMLPPVQPVVQLQQLSAAQFRRRERLNRHESVAMDMAKGLEKYSRWRLFYNVLVIWLVVPSIVCCLTYGVIPYDYFVNTRGVDNSNLDSIDVDVSGNIWAVTLVPWVVIMTATAALSLEIYSTIISEIEFGVVIWEETPFDYLKACLASIGSCMAVQSLVFGVSEAGHIRNWLAVITSGFSGMVLTLSQMFLVSRSASLSCGSGPSMEARITFTRFVFGLFLLYLGCSIGYTVFAIVYAQYSYVLDGAIGYILAFLFPCLKFSVTSVMENCPYTRWGSKRGQLCSGSIVAIVVTLWHTGFGCLVVTSSQFRGQFVLLAMVEFISYSLIVLEILALPSTSILGIQDLNSSISGGLKYKNDDRNPLQGLTSSSWRSKSSIVADFSSFHDASFSLKSSIRTLKGVESTDKNKKNEIGTNGKYGKTENERNSVRNELPGIDIKGSKYSVVSDRLSLSYKSPDSRREAKQSMSIETPFVYLLSLIKSTRVRTVEDDSRELQLGTYLGITSVTGVLTPLVFLICSTVFSIGMNKRLFSQEGIRSTGGGSEAEISAVTSDWEYRANLHRIWSLNVFADDTGDKASPSTLVYILITISLFHMVLLLLGCAVLSSQFPSLKITLSRREEENRASELEMGKTGDDIDNDVNSCSASQDICGLLSALLEYHQNIIALSSVMTMVIVISVVFPWYGMNASF